MKEMDANLRTRLDIVLDHLDEMLPAGAGTVRELIEECKRLRAKLIRVADRLRFAANSEGGIVAEIEDTLADRSDDDRFG